MKRRALVSALLGAALAPAVFAQRERVRTVGLLGPGNVGRRGLPPALARHGWIEGTNLRFEVRRVAPDGSDAEEGARELVRRAPDVLFASGYQFVMALARATRTIPIVIGGISDPVSAGLAQTLQRPGGNVTGLSFGLPEAAVLQVGTLRSLLPRLRRIVIFTAAGDPIERPLHEHEAAVAQAGIALDLRKVSAIAEMERQFRSMRRGEDAAWIPMLPADATAGNVAAAALRHHIATHAGDSDWVRAGFLMSYWLIHSDSAARVAALIDKVLRGEGPARLPFEQPDQTEFVINRATAAALGIVPGPDILLRATEVVG